MEWWLIAIVVGVIGWMLLTTDRSDRGEYEDTPYHPPLPKHPDVAHANHSAQPPAHSHSEELNVSDITLSDEQQAIYDKLEQGSGHIFITGKAGTGKSVLLQYFKQHTAKKVVVAAPTGVAALNVGGQTIHSLFMIAPKFVRKSELKLSPKTRGVLRQLDAVIIDEISMVRADLMDAIDAQLRTARSNDEPFGGAQIIMFGDPYQLPPVVSDPELHRHFQHNHGGPYFFNAHVWREVGMEVRELQEIHRQKDEQFREILNAIRKRTRISWALEELNKRAKAKVIDEQFITLAGNNAQVTQINDAELRKLPGDEKQFEAIVSGKLEEGAYPTEDLLKLKVGAQVMFVRNDIHKRWVNGTVGRVTSIEDDTIFVEVRGRNGSPVSHPVPRETWVKFKYFYDATERKLSEDPVSSFTQFPLRLAWALTIHKSQGQTYDAVLVDLSGGAFAHGQAYVALSRCRTLEGLYLSAPLRRDDIIVDPIITTFMDNALANKRVAMSATPVSHVVDEPF